LKAILEVAMKAEHLAIFVVKKMGNSLDFRMVVQMAPLKAVWMVEWKDV
jgi:hypothetical protein